MNYQNIYDIFDIDGLLSQKLKNYEFREGQLNMALDVAECYSEPGIAAIEAGTGIGKSFAYLANALEYAFKDPEDRTVVATSTINLQKQLIEKDLPMLFEAFGKKCNVALAVGRNNYLCLRRLDSEARNFPLMTGSEVSDLARLVKFSNETETGLKTDYKDKLDWDLWNLVCSDGDLCMGSKCPFFKECFYFKSKKKLAQASVIICNHHLLFIDSHTRYINGIGYEEDCILPPFDRLVIDEAHNIERHATDLFTEEFSSYIFRHQSEFIYNPRNKSAGRVGILEELSSGLKNKDLFAKCVEDINLVNSDVDTLNVAMLDRLSVNGLSHILLSGKTASRFFESFITFVDRTLEDGKLLIKDLNAFVSDITVTEENENRVSDLSVLVSRLSDILATLKTFVSFSQWKEEIHFIESEKRGNANYAIIRTAPLDVSSILKEAIFKKISSVLCTSATLDLKDDFNYWSSSIGLPVEGKKLIKKVYNSPFDYKNRLMLLTPYDAPDFDKDKQEQYAQYLVSTIEQAVSSSGGGSLILFTSVKLMDYCCNALKPTFESLGINTLKQGEFDRYTLLEKFKTDTDSVLFATDSFWEGVDAPGNTLRLVIITKLPFRMPDEPIYKARLAKLEQEGKSGFFCLSLPDATMRLKQGFGRLLRHTTDKGIVLILDSRLVSKGYGAMMISSLPESYHPDSETSTIGQKIENFLY